MIRNAVLAAVAAAVAAAALPATAAESIHISTVGKSPSEISVAVRKAARQLCSVSDGPLDKMMESACIRATVRDALTQTNDPALMKLAAR
jgi:hypothetical protein